MPDTELTWKDAEAILNRAQQYAFVAFWTGNGSIISYHGKNANPENYSYPFGITQDKTVLHPEPNKRPTAFFQWQINKENCDRLKIDVKDMPIAENNVDIIFGTWDSRSSDQTFEGVTLPFVIGESNTGYTFTDSDNQWYMVGVAFKNPVSKSATLDVTCTSEELPTDKSSIMSKGLMLEGSYRWNGNGSLISGMFESQFDENGIFRDVTKVHPSPEKPVVFFQWMTSETCSTINIDAPTLTDSEKNVHIVHKVWDSKSYSIASCKVLPCSVNRLRSVSGSWQVLGVAFDNPVSQTATVEAKCIPKN
jgi:hypothetical protein